MPLGGYRGAECVASEVSGPTVMFYYNQMKY